MNLLRIQLYQQFANRRGLGLTLFLICLFGTALRPAALWAQDAQQEPPPATTVYVPFVFAVGDEDIATEEAAPTTTVTTLTEEDLPLLVTDAVAAPDEEAPATLASTTDTTLGSVAPSQQGWHASVTWAFFFGVRNGSVNAGTRYVVTADIFKEEWRMARIEQTVPATCTRNGRVAMQQSAAVFNGGFLTCKPQSGGTFQMIVEQMIKRSKYGSYINSQSINYQAYTDPWAAAHVDLGTQPTQSEFGMFANHPDVALKLWHDGTESHKFRLALNVISTDLLKDTGWGLDNGQNQFWAGHNSNRFMAHWRENLAWEQYLYFLPLPASASSASPFPLTDELLFWHNEHTDTKSWSGTLGAPSDANDLTVTIGCDAQGKNCVHMVLYTLALDPTCMGG